MPFSFQSTKEVSASTAKIYKSKLNKLVAYGFSSSSDLLSSPLKVCAAVNALTDSIEDTEKKHYERRVFYSAIFYALHDSDLLKDPQNIYRIEFHKANPSIVSATGKPWQSAL